MDVFVIEGGSRLEGTIRVQGAKNAALPLMAATLLGDGEVELLDVPALADIASMARLLEELGCAITTERDRTTIRVQDPGNSHARYDIVRTMRASISVLGPLLARRGWARVSMPGGCTIGDRPVDLHLRGLEALGATIELDGGDIVARAPRGGLRGARIFLGGAFGSTVLGTANVMCAATLARGQTIIESAACEPEIVDLARLLGAMGAKISGAGSPRVIVEGVEALGGCRHRVLPDRIEAGTLMCAAAITHGDITLENCPLDAMLALWDTFARIGIRVEVLDETDPLRARCRVTRENVLCPVQVTTQPHPGFPTDLQAQLMALLCLVDGNSIVTEKIFSERFMHVPELSRMGASLHRAGASVVVSGVGQLRGAPVMASDLRASAGLVIAGLAASGTTIVNRVYHLDRGYEGLDRRLSALGGRVERIDEKKLGSPPTIAVMPASRRLASAS